MRRALREENVELKIYKNTISSRAAEKAGYNDLAGILTGPNAIAFGEDSVAPSRILAKFSRRNPKRVLKGGVVENAVVDADAIKTLSTLPNKEGMLSMLLGCLQSPIITFALAVKAVAEKDGGAEEKAE